MDERPGGSPETEKRLLGQFLASGDFDVIAEHFAAEDFRSIRHRYIFGAMMNLHRNNEAVDRVMIANELLKNAQLEFCGGLCYLFECFPDREEKQQKRCECGHLEIDHWPDPRRKCDLYDCSCEDFSAEAMPQRNN